MEILELLTTIKEDWAIIVAVFTISGFWWQGKAWFKKINDTLASLDASQEKQSVLLAEITNKLETIDGSIEKIEYSLSDVHADIHQQEIKLAVIESTRDMNEYLEPRRKTARRNQ